MIELIAEEIDILNAKLAGDVGKVERRKIRARLVVLEEQALDLIATSDLEKIELAKNDDEPVVDDLSEMIEMVQGKKDTLQSLREDCEFLEGLGYES